MKIKTFVLLFNPNIEDLTRWIELDVSLYCNTPVEVGRANYYGTGSNIGIARALMEMSNISKGEGFDGFIFFDQDTVIDKKVMNQIKDNLNSSSVNSLVHFSGIYPSSIDVNYVINSCTFFPNSLIEISVKEGLLDFFVDGVDLYISVIARMHEYPIQRIYISGINHIENQDWIYFQILQRKFRIKNYSDIRVKELMTGHLRLLRRVVTMFLLKDIVYLLKLVFTIAVWYFYRTFLLNFAKKI